MPVRQILSQILAILLSHIDFFDTRRLEDASVTYFGECQ